VRTLAIDTSTLAGSVAVLENDRLDGVVATRSGETYSSRLFRHVKLLLDELKLGLEQIDLYAVAAGPGSFTGLRVGLAAVKGWAEAYAKPVAAVSALEAVAAEARAGERLLVPVIDARRGQIFAGLYERTEGSLKRRGEEVVMEPGEFLDWLAREVSAGSFAFVTPSPEVLAGPLGRSSLRDRAIETVASVLAPEIGRLGLARARAGELVDALRLDANYIRRSDAELLWKK
jgi:tRNA threonylcarbamoyladenosine biosynthesis protein TsaB